MSNYDLSDKTEAQIKDFIPSLKALLSNDENPFEVFQKFIEQGLPLYFTQIGYIGDEAKLTHIRPAIVIAKKMNDIGALGTDVEVHLGNEQKSMEPLQDIYVRLVDVELLYEKLNRQLSVSSEKRLYESFDVGDVPWPGRVEYGEASDDFYRLDEIEVRTKKLRKQMENTEVSEKYSDFKAELTALEAEKIDIKNRIGGKCQYESTHMDNKDITERDAELQEDMKVNVAGEEVDNLELDEKDHNNKDRGAGPAKATSERSKAKNARIINILVFFRDLIELDKKLKQKGECGLLLSKNDGDQSVLEIRVFRGDMSNVIVQSYLSDGVYSHDKWKADKKSICEELKVSDIAFLKERSEQSKNSHERQAFLDEFKVGGD